MAVNNKFFRIMYRNLIDVAALTATPAPNNVASMPIDYVKNFDRVKSFRNTTIDATGITISGELPGPERISGVVLYRHNLRAGDTWRIRVWEGAGKTGAVFDTGFVAALIYKKLGELDTKVDTLVSTVFDDPGWTTAFSRLFFGSIVGRSFEIQVISDGNPAGYIDINRIWLARAISFQRNFGFDYALDWKDLSKIDLSEGESVKVDKSGNYRVIQISVPRVMDIDRGTMADVIRIAGNSSEVFIDLFPEQEGKLERDYTMTAVLIDHSPLRSLNINKHTISFTLRET